MDNMDLNKQTYIHHKVHKKKRLLPSGSPEAFHQSSWSRLFFFRSLNFDSFFQSVGDRLPNSLESLDHGETPSSLCAAPEFSLVSNATLGWSNIAQDSPWKKWASINTKIIVHHWFWTVCTGINTCLFIMKNFGSTIIILWSYNSLIQWCTHGGIKGYIPPEVKTGLTGWQWRPSRVDFRYQ